MTWAASESTRRAKQFSDELLQTSMIITSTGLSTAEVEHRVMECVKVIVCAYDDRAAGLLIPLDAGIWGSVIHTGETIRIDYACSDGCFHKEADAKSCFVTQMILSAPEFQPSTSCHRVVS